jgi:hypothetical protein
MCSSTGRVKVSSGDSEESNASGLLVGIKNLSSFDVREIIPLGSKPCKL